jgi:acyl-CoA synthetase (AMP-forming)/AMP-acid ligase II
MRIIDFFDRGAELYPHNIAFIDGDERLTYTQAADATHRIAAALHAHGYAKGAKIGVYAPNSNIAFLSLLGLMRAEGVWIPINPRNSIAVNADLLRRFDGELLLYHSMFEAEVRQILAVAPNIKAAVCIDATSERNPSLASWLEGSAIRHEVGPQDEHEVMAIFPTGGTTGESKGVLMTHRSIATLFANFFAHFHYYDGTCHLVVAPMTHSAGILGCMHFARGGTNVIARKVEPGAILSDIQTYKVTHLFLPPTVLYMMLAHPDVKKYDYSSLQHFLIAAAPSSLEKVKEAIGVFGPVMSECFGQAECPAAITMKAPWDYLGPNGEIDEARLQSVGRPAVFNTVAILDDEGCELPRGEMGEICVKGALVTPGYYKQPEATAEIRSFGWHHTGDIGVMDGDGFITMMDRKRDMIISGGFNVYPNEIEQVIAAHPRVQECAVIGVPDEKWGEAVKAVVLLKPGAPVDAEELIHLVKGQLGGVKAPKSIDFVADLPRSPAGKVMKKEIRKAYWVNVKRGIN